MNEQTATEILDNRYVPINLIKSKDGHIYYEVRTRIRAQHATRDRVRVKLVVFVDKEVK